MAITKASILKIAKDYFGVDANGILPDARLSANIARLSDTVINTNRAQFAAGDTLDILPSAFSPYTETVATFSAISTSLLKRTIVVTTDETNGNVETVYLHTGVSLHRLTSTRMSVVDADATALFTASGITSPSLRTAINTAFLDMKLWGIWQLQDFIYLAMGGTETAHSLNAKNPLLTNAAFQLSFAFAVTHNSAGIGFTSGTETDTHWSPLTNGLQNDMSLTYYTSTEAATGDYMGASKDDGSGAVLTGNIGGNTYTKINDSGAEVGPVSFVNNAGPVTISRLNATGYTLWHNGLLKNTITRASATPTAATLSLNGTRYENGGRSGRFEHVCLFASGGRGLSQPQIEAYHAIIKTLQAARA